MRGQKLGLPKLTKEKRSKNQKIDSERGWWRRQFSPFRMHKI